MILTVCANVCIDEYIRSDNTLILPAGKGVNVAISLSNIGVEVECLMFMPRESEMIFSKYLKEHNVKGHYEYLNGKARTNKKVIDMHGNITEYSGQCEQVNAELEQKFIEKFTPLAKRAEYVVISGSLPAGAQKDFYKRLINIAGGKKCIYDSSRDALKEGIAASPIMIKPNIFEFNALTGKHFENESQIILECKKYIDGGIKFILLSMGSDGAIITDGVKAYSASMNNESIINTTGAGDAMVAASIRCLIKGNDIKEILKHAVCAATQKIGHLHPYITDTKYLNYIQNIQVKEIQW